jgi:hypothetical protein
MKGEIEEEKQGHHGGKPRVGEQGEEPVAASDRFLRRAAESLAGAEQDQ